MVNRLWTSAADVVARVNVPQTLGLRLAERFVCIERHADAGLFRGIADTAEMVAVNAVNVHAEHEDGLIVSWVIVQVDIRQAAFAIGADEQLPHGAQQQVLVHRCDALGKVGIRRCPAQGVAQCADELRERDPRIPAAALSDALPDNGGIFVRVQAAFDLAALMQAKPLPA